MIGHHAADTLNIILRPIVSIGITVRNLSLGCIVILTIFVLAVLKLESVFLTGCFASGFYNVSPCMLFNVFRLLLRLITYRAHTLVAYSVFAGLLIIKRGRDFIPICDVMSLFGYVISNIAVAAIAGVGGIALLSTGRIRYCAFKVMRSIILRNIVTACGAIPMSTAIRTQSSPKFVI